MEFIGRETELDLLRQALRSPKSAFIPIHGRRRVGKSELILKFMADEPGLYYLGQQSSPSLQVREFLGEAARALGMPLLADLRAADWQPALRTVTEQWTRANPGRKLVLALDEFQWIAASSPNLLSELQHCWDRWWRDAGNVLLLLCGSSLGFMGRRTAQIHLQPFGYRDAARFHPRWSLADRARAYFLVGGLPHYLLCLDDSRSIDVNIREQLLAEFAPLFHEPVFLLREELREIAPYQATLHAVASGRGTAPAIAAATGLPERSMHYYLQQLTGLGYLRRRYPLAGSRPNPRRVRFEIDDPLLRFWFRFVFPNVSVIRSAGPARALADRIAPALEAWFGGGFKRLCREALPLIYAREGVTAGFEVGAYWSTATQIDVVGLRDDGWTDLGECKWGSVRSPGALESELERKLQRYPNNRGATLARRYFTRRKPATRREADGWYSLDDLYSL